MKKQIAATMNATSGTPPLITPAIANTSVTTPIPPATLPVRTRR